MIARLIDWSARNLMLVLTGAVFAVAAGVYSLQHSALDAIPELSDTQVASTTHSLVIPNLSPETTYH